MTDAQYTKQVDYDIVNRPTPGCGVLGKQPSQNVAIEQEKKQAAHGTACINTINRSFVMNIHGQKFYTR